MPRPIGMRKIAGVWYRKEELDSNGMPLVTRSAVLASEDKNNAGVYQTTHDVISSLSVSPNGLSGHSEIAPVKVQGIHTYSPEEIKSIENQTGLRFAGNFASGSAADLIPVFLKADHDEETRRGKMAHIRKGI